MGWPPSAAAPLGVCSCVSAHLFLYIMNIYGYSLYIPCICLMYFILYVLNSFDIFAFVCILIYSVNTLSVAQLVPSTG